MTRLRRLMTCVALGATTVTGSTDAREASVESCHGVVEPPSAPESANQVSSLPCVERSTDGSIVKRTRSIMSDEGPDLAVVIFVTTTCPIANATMPSIRRLHETAGKLGADLVLVHPDPLVTPRQAFEHADRRKLEMDILLDADQRLARSLGARVVPEAFVLQRTDQGWQTRYRGPVDDLYAGVGRRRRAATAFHAADAIQKIRSGLPIKQPRRTAHGCAIERMLGS